MPSQISLDHVASHRGGEVAGETRGGECGEEDGAPLRRLGVVTLRQSAGPRAAKRTRNGRFVGAASQP